MAVILTENERRLIDGITVSQYYNDYIVPLDPKKYRPMNDVKPTGLCPFHSDTDPSFHDWRAKKAYHCFGCGTSGDIIRLHQQIRKKYHNEYLSKEDSMLDLARLYNIALEMTEKGEVRVESPFDRARKKLLNPAQYDMKDSSKLTVASFRAYNNQTVKNKQLAPMRKANSYQYLDIMLAAFLMQEKAKDSSEGEGTTNA